MKHSLGLNELELALIEVEYATADFNHRKASVAETLELGDFEALLSKLMAATRAVQLALSTLGNFESRRVA
jgi:hypothetical protein